MRLVQVFSILCAEFSIGTLLVTALISPRLLPAPFFSFNSLLCAVLAGLGLLCLRISLPIAWWDTRYLGLTVIAATVSYGCYRLEKRDFGRGILIIAGLVGLMFGLLPMADRVMRAWNLATTVPYVFGASTILGAALLGVAFVVMFFVQWRAIVRGGFFELLNRLTIALLILIGLRALLLTGTVAGLSQIDPELATTLLPTLWADDLLVFSLRIALGVAIPAMFAWQSFLLVSEKAEPPVRNYVLAFVSIVVGEFLAAKLLI